MQCLDGGIRQIHTLFMILILKMTHHTLIFFSRSSRDTLLGSYPAQPPRIQEEAVEDDRAGPGLCFGRLAGPVQRGLRDGPEGDLFVPQLSLCW